MLRIVSLRLPSGRLTTEKPSVAGRHVMPAKKLKGARFTRPWALTEDTQAIGRGMMALASKSCASRDASVLRSISVVVPSGGLDCGRDSPCPLRCSFDFAFFQRTLCPPDKEPFRRNRQFSSPSLELD